MDFKYNDKTLRKAQLVQLELLIEFDRICKANNIKYQLFAGTLLGAIRHQGFIPWDDDIDIIMIRSEYEKFQEICKEHISPKYFLQNYQSDPNYYRQFARLRKNNTRYVQDVYKNVEMHHGIFIDIFPMDRVMPDTTSERTRWNILVKLSRLNKFRNRGVPDYYPSLKRVFWKAAIAISNVFYKKPVFDRMQTKILKRFEHKNTGFINHLTDITAESGFKRFLMREQDFYDVIDGEFEKNKFPIPKNYHQVLSRTYGDYMKFPPKEEQRPHHGVFEISFDTNETP